jgi:hypothetical protein
MATRKKVGIFPEPLVHNVEAARLKHLMSIRGVDSVRADVEGEPALIEVSSLAVSTGSEPDYVVTAEFPARDMFQLQGAPLATEEMEALLRLLEWHQHESA